MNIRAYLNLLLYFNIKNLRYFSLKNQCIDIHLNN